MSFEDDVRQIARDLALEKLDPHGQPKSRRFNQLRRVDRDLAEMVGLAKGLIADGIVNDEEVHFLNTWAANHPAAISQWPCSLVFTRIKQFFADGRIDEDERRELGELLTDLVGGQTTTVLGLDGAAELPLNRPAPLMCYGPDEVYVFTGRFAYGPRRICESEVTSRASEVEGNVTRRTTFLVVGTFASADWINTSYGRKIQRAAELRDSGFPVRIVGEDHWAGSLAAV